MSGAALSTIVEQKAKSTRVMRKPSAHLRAEVLEFAKLAIKEGYSYRDAQDLARFALLETAKTIKKTDVGAGELLGIDRNHVRSYRARGVEVLKP